MTADNKISMCSESVRTRRRGCDVVHCARPVDNTAQLELDTVADKPPVPPRRPGQQNDSSPQEAVRAHWREVVRRARPVDNTARLDLDADNTARLDPETVADKPSAPPRQPRPQNNAALHEPVRTHWREVVHRARPLDNTARLDLDPDNTARLDPETVPVKPSAPPRRQQNDAARHEAVRARGPGGEVVRRARPVDSTARLDLDPDNTARLDPETVPVKPSAPPRRPRQQNDAARHEAVRARGPGGDVVRRARPVDSLHDFGGGPLSLRLRRGGRHRRTKLHCTR